MSWYDGVVVGATLVVDTLGQCYAGREVAMNDDNLITSRQNDRIKAAAALKDRRDRDRTGLTLVEGERELRTAVEAGVTLQTAFICDDLLRTKSARTLINRAANDGAEVLQVTKEVFYKLSYRQNPDGVAAVLQPPLRELETLSAGSNAFMIVIVGAEKPGNIGAILRTADASGVDAVVLCDGRTDLYNPNVIRASMGTVFTVNVVEADSQETVEWMRMHDVPLAVATPDAEQLYHEQDLTGPVALVFGSEDVGVSADWRMEAVATLGIPMLGKADSINLSASVSVMAFEVVRQRSTNSDDGLIDHSPAAMLMDD